MTRPRILLAVTSHDQLGATGRPTGAYLAEVAHPYAALIAAGFDVDFVSPRGGQVPLDGVKDADEAGRAFLADEATVARLARTPASADVDPAPYQAIFYAGGHGTMWDFPDDPGLQRLGAAIYERGGVVAAVCHGPAALVNLRLSDGRHLVDGKEVAGFTNDEERAVGLTDVVPFLLADALVARGAVHRPAPSWQPQVVTSERLVTGQNPASARGTADAVVALLAPR